MKRFVIVASACAAVLWVATIAVSQTSSTYMVSQDPKAQNGLQFALGTRLDGSTARAPDGARLRVNTLGRCYWDISLDCLVCLRGDGGLMCERNLATGVADEWTYVVRDGGTASTTETLYPTRDSDNENVVIGDQVYEWPLGRLDVRFQPNAGNSVWDPGGWTGEDSFTPTAGDWSGSTSVPFSVFSLASAITQARSDAFMVFRQAGFDGTVLHPTAVIGTTASDGSAWGVDADAGRLADIYFLTRNPSGEMIERMRVYGNAAGTRVGVNPLGEAPASVFGVIGNVSIGASAYYTTAAPTGGLLVQGKVGIGTTAPIAKAGIAGDVAIGATYATGGGPANGLAVEGSVGIGTTNPLSKVGVIGSASIGATYGAVAAPTSGLLVEGTTGIGTSAPLSKLGVVGNLAVGATYGAQAASTSGLIVEGTTCIGCTSVAVGAQFQVTGQSALLGTTAVYGDVGILNDDGTARAVKFYEPSGSGTNYTGIKAVTQSADINYTLPNAQGAASTLLTNDGAGALSWTTLASAGIVSGTCVSGAGNVTYWTASDTVGCDGSQLFWDATNNRLGIGTGSPGTTLEVAGAMRQTGTTAVFGAMTATTNKSWAAYMYTYAGAASNTITWTSTVAGSWFDLGTPAAAMTLYGSSVAVPSLTASRLVVTDSSATPQLVSTITSANMASSISDETGTLKAVFSDAPTFTTNITTPKVIGGTGVGSDLDLCSTSGVGDGTDTLLLKVGNNCGTTVATVTSTGIGIRASPSYPLDVSSGASPTIVVGADLALTSRTNNTNKIGSIAAPHYANASSPYLMVGSASTSTTNQVAIGGGTAGVNAATSVTVWTGATTTTDTGTAAWSWNSSGDFMGQASTPNIFVDTTDAADSKRLALSSGGALSHTRGAYLYLSGNEFVTGSRNGDIVVVAGAGDGVSNLGDIEFYTAAAATLRVKIDGAGNVNIAGLTASRLVSTDSSKNLTNTITSANAAASVSDETGGAAGGTMVFSNAPSIASPTFTGTITTPLTASRFVTTNGSSQLATSGASADLIATLSDETGSGVAVFGTSPNFTTSVTTGSASFDVFNTNATTVNAFGGASTALNMGNASGTIALAGPTTIAAGKNLSLLSGAGQFLQTSTNATGTTTSSSMSLAYSSLTSGTGLYAASSTLSSGKLMDLQVSGTAAASNTQTVLNVATAGANGTASQTTYGTKISNTHTGTSSTNVAGYFLSSGGTNNYGLVVAGGDTGLGTATPTAFFDVSGAAVTSGTGKTVLAMTNGAHTGLNNANFNDVYINLTRTVTFSGGGSAFPLLASNWAHATYAASSGQDLTFLEGIRFAAPNVGANISSIQGIHTSVGINPNTTTTASHASLSYRPLNVFSHTATVNGNTNVTSTPGAAQVYIGKLTLSAASALTFSTAASLYIQDAPAASGAGPAAITSSYAIFVDAGTTRLDGALQLGSTVTQYNGTTTTESGVPSFQTTSINLTGQTANIAATNIKATAAAGRYRMCVQETVTTAATTSSTLPTVNCIWTDNTDSVAKTVQVAASNTGNTTATGTTGCCLMNVKASTNIQYSTTNYASVGGTSLAYDLYITLETL